MGGVQEQLCKNRLETIAQAQARYPSSDEQVLRYAEDDEIDVYRGSESKDVPGWHGPVKVAAANKQDQNKSTVEWKNGTITVPLTEARPHRAPDQ